MCKKISYIILACFIAAGAMASGAGSSAGDFLNISTGARAAGMGDAAVSGSTGAEAIYWNPAGIAGARGEALFSHTIWAADSSLETAGQVLQLSKGSSAGILVNYFMSGAINKVDNTGLKVGTYSNSDISVALCWGLNIAGGFPFGVSLKYIGSTIDGTASTAFAADLGVRYSLGNSLVLGAAVQNIGMQLKYNSLSESLPMNIIAGLLFKAGGSLSFEGDVNIPSGGSFGYSAGAEYAVSLGGSTSAALRAGYKSAGTGSLSGLSAGAGIGFGGIYVDYALIMFGDLGNNHRVSLKVNI